MGTPQGTEQPRDDMNQAIGPEVSIPGPYPSGQAPTSEEAAEAPAAEEAPPVTRDAGSLGDLTQEQSTSTVAAESGGLGSPLYDEEEQENH
jgi:hypothetical protein